MAIIAKTAAVAARTRERLQRIMIAVSDEDTAKESRGEVILRPVIVVSRP
jgi:hypothetical protein